MVSTQLKNINQIASFPQFSEWKSKMLETTTKERKQSYSYHPFSGAKTLVLGRNHPPYNWVGKVSSPTTHKKEPQLRLQAKGGSWSNRAIWAYPTDSIHGGLGLVVFTYIYIHYKNISNMILPLKINHSCSDCIHGSDGICTWTFA